MGATARSFAPEAHSVLVVDDTAANRRLYGTLIRKSGFVVRTAESGAEALRMIEEEVPSLVVLDYMMPEMDGVVVLQRLRAERLTQSVPVVMLTASAEPDHIDLALGAGANDYITKPVNAKLLIARLRSMIQAHAARTQVTASQRQDAAMQEDLQEAARVQQSQLPAVPHKWQDYRITGAVAPSGAVGGDLFDIVETPRGCITFLLDVSGHGTASALVAAEMRTELRHLLRRYPLVGAIDRLNSHLSRRASSKYCCVAAVAMDGTQVEIVNAGLPPVAVLRGTQVMEQVWGSGMPMGMFEESTYEATHLELRPGDRVVLLSDGLTEPFGATDDAVSAVERLALWPSVSDEIPTGEALRSRIRTVTKGSAPELLDDATAVILLLSGTVTEQLKLVARPDAIPRAVRWVVDQAPTWVDQSAVDHGLTEALTNAILHGTLNMSSEMRAEGGYEHYLELARELPNRPGYTDRHVELRVVTNPESFGIRLTWEGTPCPVEDRMPVSLRAPARSVEPTTPAAAPVRSAEANALGAAPDGPSNAAPDAAPDAEARVASPLSEGSGTAPTSADFAALNDSGMGMSIIVSLFDRVLWDADGLGMEIWMQRALAGRDRSKPPPGPAVKSLPSP